VTKPNPRNKNGFTRKWVAENVCNKMFLAARAGTHEQAVAYANKSDTRVAGPWTLGEFKSIDAHRADAGNKIKKSTLLDVKAAIDAGATDRELYRDHFASMLRMKSNFDTYRLAMLDDDRDQPKVLVLWGPPGTGKSHTARKICANNGGGHWWRAGNGSNDWWDGYDPLRHPVVVLDDFKGGIKYTTLLRMLDKFPMHVETKGSTKTFNPKIVVITSNSPPNSWYFQNQEDANHDSSALLRRLEGEHGAVVELKTKYVPEAAVKKPDLIQKLDELIDGTLVPRGIAIRKEYLADVKPHESRAAVAAAVVDLTTDEQLEDSDVDEYRTERLAEEAHDRLYDLSRDERDSADFVDDDFASDGDEYVHSDGEPCIGAEPRPQSGDDDDGEDDDVDDKRQHPTPPKSPEVVPWIDEVERDEYDDSVAFLARQRLRRNAMTKQSTPLAFAKPLAVAGRFKKLGPEPVQSQLFRTPRTSIASEGAAKRRRRLADDGVILNVDPD